MEQHFPRKGALVELKIVLVSVTQESSTPALRESQKLLVTFHKFLFWRVAIACNAKHFYNY